MVYKYRRCLVKISGAALASDNNNIYDKSKLLAITQQLVRLAREGIELAVVIGGGNIWRGVDADKIGIDSAASDYMGMLATIINALAMESLIKKLNYESVTVCSAVNVNKIAEPYYYKRVLRRLNQKFIVIMPAGLGQPLFTTDTAAVLRAVETKCDIILMAKDRIAGVYNSDPRINKRAKLISELNASEAIREKLRFMDWTASTLALSHKIDTLVFDISKPNSIYEVAHGRGQFSLVRGQ